MLATIKRHPLITFFLLANLLSWLAWIPYILSNNGLGLWDYTFELGQITGVLPGAYVGPLTSALVVTAITGGAAGLKTWGRRLWKWRVRWHWYAITLLGVPAALVLTGAAFSGGTIGAPSIAALAMYVPYLVLQMITTGLAEEPGWRDFALPRLQALFSPMKAAFILGPLWALWHFPLFLTEWGGYPDADWTRPFFFTVFCIAFNIVMAWIFNATGQSLPLSMLAHVSVNNFVSVVWSDMFPTIGEQSIAPVLAAGGVAAAVLVVIFTKGRLGLRKVDEPVLVGPDDSLQARPDAELGQHAGEVRLHG